MKKYIFLLIVLSGCVIACKKKQDEIPQPIYNYTRWRITTPYYANRTPDTMIVYPDHIEKIQNKVQSMYCYFGRVSALSFPIDTISYGHYQSGYYYLSSTSLSLSVTLYHYLTGTAVYAEGGNYIRY